MAIYSNIRSSAPLSLPHSSLPKGFSLVELMTVITVIVILAVVSIPCLASLSTSGKMNQSVVEIAGILEQARQFAVAKNTYVWVAFYSDTTTINGGSLAVAVFSSKDGTDPGTSGDVPGTNFDLVSRVRTFPLLHWSDAGAFTGLIGMPAFPVTTAINNVAACAFKVQIPGKPTPTTFIQAVKFQPTGEARNGNSPIDILEFAIQPQKPNGAMDGSNVAVVRVNGLTGQTRIFRR